ncbi:uncharacterized protein LOC129607252 isoform X2 [Condylostylus longicornis]|nr:uncharacterized protein LOC129607252 isoform X2 [Condylostylus longicornis]XP_055374089.1 uncharacterized protein LOC129607252 isoform X2 [Condylostylus longicornis]
MPRGGTTTTRYEDRSQNTWNCASWFEYLLIVILSTILLIGVIVLILFWVLYYRGGLAWSNQPELQFNLHPVLMVGGLVTISGYSILLYRLCRCLKHIYVKLAHMFFHACAVPCVVLGFLAVFESHENLYPDKPHFTSLHTWLGLVTMGLFGLQFVVGFFSFLILLCCENYTYSCRSAMVPIHASFGVVTLMLAIATALTGILDAYDENTKPELEKYVMKSTGMVLVAIGIVVSFAVRRSNAPATAKVYVTERI